MRMRPTAVALITVLFALAAFADKKPETIGELKARAEAARPQEQVKLFMQVARQQLETASKAYAAGDSAAAKIAVEDVAAYAEKAGQAAISTGKDQKRTEIDVRKLSRRIADLQRSVDFDDRTPLQNVSSRLEKVDTSLLEHMFRKRK